MKGPKELLKSDDNWVTNIGLSFPGERVVFRDKDLLNDLRDLKWMGLLLYGITGRLFDDKQIRLFEGLWNLSSSYPDLRLWNNRVAALAGTSRSTITLGISAAMAISEANLYGRRPDVRAIDFLYRTKKKLENGEQLIIIIKEELNKFRVIPGFGRPIVNKDERIAPVMQLAEKLGYAKGQYVNLVFNIEDILIKGRWRFRMNVAALAAALAADQNLTTSEYHCLSTPCFLAGIIPCILDTLKKPEGTFLPLRCERVAFEGRPRRIWE